MTSDDAADTLIIGGFTGDGDAPSGLALHEWDGERAQLAKLVEIENPTWFEWDAARRVLYVSQSARTTLTAVAIPGGPASARVLDVVDIGCMNPAHLALSPERDAVVAACFTGGEVVGVGLESDGRFAGVRARVQLAGRIEDAARRNVLQSEAEPHQVVFAPDGRSFDVPDRAQDVVHRFRWDGAGQFTPMGATRLRPGSGPRHLVRSPRDPRIVYLACELDNTLAVLEEGSDGLEARHVQPTLPPDVFADSAVAAIFTDATGERVFVSNRGHDSLAVFDVAADAKAPRPAGWLPIGGRTPRFSGRLDGVDAFALAAQGDDLVTVVADGVDGSVAALALIAHRAPACVKAIRIGDHG